MRKSYLALSLICLSSVALAQSAPKYKKVVLSDKFYTEGVSFGDFNKDGKIDVVAGPFWFEGPDFTKKHELYTPKTYDPNGYSDNFLTFAYDFNGDGWIDVMEVGWPGKEAHWYENPGSAGGAWKRHLVFNVVDNESPMLADLLGAGKPQLICNTNGYMGYAQADPTDATKPWKFTAISPKGKYERYTHGLGVGDVNGDGRLDVLEAEGWWEQPADAKNAKTWTFHKFHFADGACQMFAYDVDGDGVNDIITVLHPHLYGLLWHKQVRKDGAESTWEKHVIMGSKPEENAQGFKVSQLHAMNLIDVNGDGLKDIVVGKRFWAHGPKGDVEPDAPAMLMWFELKRDKEKGVQYIAHPIDDNSGVGMQVESADLNGDGAPDFMVANKKGMFLFFSEK